MSFWFLDRGAQFPDGVAQPAFGGFAVDAGDLGDLNIQSGTARLWADAVVNTDGTQDTATAGDAAGIIGGTDTGNADPDFAQPVILPPAAQQPQGTSIAIDYRGARGFNVAGLEAASDSSELDPYGNIMRGSAQGLLPQWGGDVNRADGRQFLQVRLSFINNIFSNLNAELSALGIPYELP